jgi:hypothetical protein
MWHKNGGKTDVVLYHGITGMLFIEQIINWGPLPDSNLVVSSLTEGSADFSKQNYGFQGPARTELHQMRNAFS